MKSISKNGTSFSHAILQNSEGILSIPGDFLFFESIIEVRISNAEICESRVSFVVPVSSWIMCSLSKTFDSFKRLEKYSNYSFSVIFTDGDFVSVFKKHQDYFAFL